MGEAKKGTICSAASDGWGKRQGYHIARIHPLQEGVHLLGQSWQMDGHHAGAAQAGLLVR